MREFMTTPNLMRYRKRSVQLRVIGAWIDQASITRGEFLVEFHIGNNAWVARNGLREFLDAIRYAK